MRVSDLKIDRVYINSLTRQAKYRMSPNHFHYYYEIYYLSQGECQMFISNQPYQMASGDLIVIPPREVHLNEYTTNCDRINIYFRPVDFLENDRCFFPEIESIFTKQGIIHIPTSYRSSVEAILDRMLQEEKIDDKTTPAMMTLLFRQFLLDVKRFGIHRDLTEPVFSESNKEILEAAQYIRDHYNKPLSLESLADHAGLSMTYFSRKFHQVTGMGMKEYLTYVRLSNAEKELVSTSHTITEVAINCGFSNSNYFKDAFKKNYGMSPKAYRKSRITDLRTHQSILNAQSSSDTNSGRDALS